jgi:hypothetical protein
LRKTLAQQSCLQPKGPVRRYRPDAEAPDAPLRIAVLSIGQRHSLRVGPGCRPAQRKFRTSRMPSRADVRGEFFFALVMFHSHGSRRYGRLTRHSPGFSSGSHPTLRWREMDSNFQYASTVRWHRATDLPLPPTVKRRCAGRPPPMARPRSEAQRGSVRPAAAMRSTHREMRCSAAVQAARYRAARRAAMRSAHCEIRPGENVTLQYLSHDGSPGPPAVRAAATMRPAATAPSPTAKSLPLDRRTV